MSADMNHTSQPATATSATDQPSLDDRAMALLAELMPVLGIPGRPSRAEAAYNAATVRVLNMLRELLTRIDRYESTDRQQAYELLQAVAGLRATKAERDAALSKLALMSGALLGALHNLTAAQQFMNDLTRLLGWEFTIRLLTGVLELQNGAAVRMEYTPVGIEGLTFVLSPGRLCMNSDRYKEALELAVDPAGIFARLDRFALLRLITELYPEVPVLGEYPAHVERRFVNKPTTVITLAPVTNPNKASSD